MRNVEYREIFAVCVFAVLSIFFQFETVQAEDMSSPVGVWRTYDEKTGEAKALVEIHEEFNAMFGRVVKLLPRPGRPPDPVCQFCGGDHKDQPILGMQVIWDMRKEGHEWVQGKILDPESGKIYSSKMWLENDGKILVVRGFIGFSLLGRSQRWVREIGHSN
jgi:uncharacterized protein (DUF2147 family)